MKTLIATIVMFALAVPALADSHLDAETVSKIEAWLASIDCQMDPDDIEVEEDGFELDDVICKGGQQFDIKLDGELNEVARRAE